MIAERAAERLKPPAPEPRETPTAPRPHEPGIYFGLAAAEYHPDPSLGSTDLKRLVKDPGEFWHHSPLNPDRPPSPDSKDRKEGRALHKLTLEGEAAFAAAFIGAAALKPPGCLVSWRI
jgi:hypothetical protein